MVNKLLFAAEIQYSELWQTMTRCKKIGNLMCFMIQYHQKETMNKTSDYTTIIPIEDKLLEITVKILPQKTKKTSRWDEICRWGQDFAKQKKIDPNKVDKTISARRYGKN